MMARVNLLCDHIAEHSAHKNVGRKMLPAAHAGIAHRASQAIRQYFRKWAGIFVRQNSRHGPRRRRMFGWERSSALKKRAAAIALKWPFASQRVLQAFHHHLAIERRFPGKKSRFAPVLVMADVPQQPETARASEQRSQSGIRNIVVAANRLRIARKMQAGVAVSDEKRRSNSSRGDQPFGIGKSKPDWTCPQTALVFRESHHELS